MCCRSMCRIGLGILGRTLILLLRLVWCRIRLVGNIFCGVVLCVGFLLRDRVVRLL